MLWLFLIFKEQSVNIFDCVDSCTNDAKFIIKQLQNKSDEPYWCDDVIRSTHDTFLVGRTLRCDREDTDARARPLGDGRGPSGRVTHLTTPTPQWGVARGARQK